MLVNIWPLPRSLWKQLKNVTQAESSRAIGRDICMLAVACSTGAIRLHVFIGYQIVLNETIFLKRTKYLKLERSYRPWFHTERTVMVWYFMVAFDIFYCINFSLRSVSLARIAIWNSFKRRISTRALPDYFNLGNVFIFCWRFVCSLFRLLFIIFMMFNRIILQSCDQNKGQATRSIIVWKTENNF